MGPVQICQFMQKMPPSQSFCALSWVASQNEFGCHVVMCIGTIPVCNKFFWVFFLCSHAVFLFCMFVLRGSSHRWSGEDRRVQGRHFYYDVQHGCRRDSIARFGAAQGSSQTATAKVIARRYVFFLLFYFLLFLFCLVAFILKKLTGKKKEREREVSVKERLFMWFFFLFLFFLFYFF